MKKTKKLTSIILDPEFIPSGLTFQLTILKIRTSDLRNGEYRF
jgi:hypothetical protein